MRVEDKFVVNLIDAIQAQAPVKMSVCTRCLAPVLTGTFLDLDHRCGPCWVEEVEHGEPSAFASNSEKGGQHAP